jgi:DNA-binding GntR family transcriptional regulator
LILNWRYNIVIHYRELHLRWHTDLIRALNNGDPEKADRKMRERVRVGMQEALRRLEASIGLVSAAAPFGRSVEPAGGLAGVSWRKR